MFKSLGVRWFVIGLILLFVAYKIFPTIQFYSLSKEESAQIELDEPEKLKELKRQSINLGLDLQGGMHVVLEVDLPIMAENLAEHKNDLLINAINDAKTQSINNQTDFFDEFEKITGNIEIPLVKYYATLDGLAGKSNSDVLATLREQGEYAISSALEIIRNRIDEFGVSEPVIQKSGNNRIIVELAGVKDTERARKLIQSTALLEFILVKQGTEFSDLLKKIDNKLKATSESSENNKASENTENVVAENDVGSDTSKTDELDQIFSDEENFDTDDPFTISEEVLKNNPFSGYIRSYYGGTGILAQDVAKFSSILYSEDVQKLIPNDSQILLSNQNQTATTQEGVDLEFRNIYYLNMDAVVEGGSVVDARASFGGVGTNVSGQPVVNLTMDPDGAKDWARFTGSNIGRNVSIVLDKKVYMSPVIRDRIPGGRTQISGLTDINEAKDIANVLRAGKLPAPVNIVEERTVGPSLGQDSIEAGTLAMFYGFITVIVFMIFYYRGAGLLANISLLLNLFIVMGALAMLKATLTLPGIAGLILTIGMAVDANVIIFERIREELDKGKTVNKSIEGGYNRAFTTILDANVTTLIAAFVLAWIGSGPIKGFAVTLSVGILSSMFTAVFVTRTIFMMLGNKKPLTKLSI